MKTTLLYILLFVVLISSSSGQSLKSFGVKSGGTMATQSWVFTKNVQFTPTYRFGPAAGIFVEGFKVGNFSMLGEIWYVQKGFTAAVKTKTVSPSLIYFSVPFLLKYRYENDGVDYFCLAGPRIDYLFHIDPQSLTIVSDAMSEGNSDVGITVGLGTQFFGSILAEVRYSPSLVNAYKSDSLTIKNNSFEFVIGISL